MVTISRSLIFMEISLTHTTTSTFKTELKPKVQRNGRTYNTVITTRPNLPQNASSGAKNQSAVVFMPRNNLQKFDSAKNTTLFTCIQQNTSRVFSNIFGKLFIRYSLRQSSRLARPGLDHDLATFSSSWELKYLTLSQTYIYKYRMTKIFSFMQGNMPALLTVIATRSMTPLNSASFPIGSCSTAGTALRLSCRQHENGNTRSWVSSGNNTWKTKNDRDRLVQCTNRALPYSSLGKDFKLANYNYKFHH